MILFLCLFSVLSHKGNLPTRNVFCLFVYKFGGTEVNPVISSDCFGSRAKCAETTVEILSKKVNVAKPRADKLPVDQYKAKTKLKLSQLISRAYERHASCLVENAWHRVITRNEGITQVLVWANTSNNFDDWWATKDRNSITRFELLQTLLSMSMLNSCKNE